MDFRPYTPADHAACAALCGPFTPPTYFYVLDHDGQILGCGGFTHDGELVLGTVHPDFRRQGLGRFLLLARLRELAKLPGLTRARLQAPRLRSLLQQTRLQTHPHPRPVPTPPQRLSLTTARHRSTASRTSTKLVYNGASPNTSRSPSASTITRCSASSTRATSPAPACRITTRPTPTSAPSPTNAAAYSPNARAFAANAATPASSVRSNPGSAAATANPDKPSPLPAPL